MSSLQLHISDYKQASIEHPERCEDAIVILNRQGNAPVLAVIDGLGGHQHQDAAGTLITGHDASSYIADMLIRDLATLPADIRADPNGLAQEKLKAAMLRANKAIYEEINRGHKTQLNERVGAVLTVIILCENGQRLLCGQVGDTRAYLLTDGDFIQVCVDEDNIEYLLKRGLINEDDAARISDILNQFDGVNEPQDLKGTIFINKQPYDLYLAWRWFLYGNAAVGIPGANVVMNALGLYADDPVPQFSRLEVLPGDTLLVCSDGLHKNLTEAEIIEKMSLNQEGIASLLGKAAYERSMDIANRRRTPDDISAIVVSFGNSPP